jgi:transposase
MPWRKPEGACSCRMRTSGRIDCRCRHGTCVNANLVHKWRAQAAKHQDTAVTASNASFVPVPVEAAALTSKVTELRIGLRRGPATATVSWPMLSAAECAAWLREVLR